MLEWNERKNKEIAEKRNFHLHEMETANSRSTVQKKYGTKEDTKNLNFENGFYRNVGRIVTIFFFVL